MKIKTARKDVGDMVEINVEVTMNEYEQMRLEAYCEVIEGKAMKEFLKDLTREIVDKHIESGKVRLAEIIC